VAILAEALGNYCGADREEDPEAGEQDQGGTNEVRGIPDESIQGRVILSSAKGCSASGTIRTKRSETLQIVEMRP
jgi:hypothetical protein